MTGVNLHCATLIQVHSSFDSKVTCIGLHGAMNTCHTDPSHVGSAEPADSSLKLIERFGVAGLAQELISHLSPNTVKFQRGKESVSLEYNAFSLVFLAPPSDF